MYLLGISAYYHDSAACLIKDGEIIAAAQEERFTRKKHDAAFPHQSIQYCLREANIDSDQINNVVFYEKPFVKFERRTTLFIPVVLLRVVLEHPDAPAECSIVRDARHWRESARTQVRALVRVLVSSAVRQRQGTQRGWTSQSCGAQAGAQDTMITQVLTALAPVRAGGAAQE